MCFNILTHDVHQCMPNAVESAFDDFYHQQLYHYPRISEKGFQI